MAAGPSLSEFTPYPMLPHGDRRDVATAAASLAPLRIKGSPMAKKIDNFNENNQEMLQAGRPPEYPWHLWLDGGTWEIKQGVDFHSQISSMITLIRYTAANYDIKISVLRKADNVTLIIKPRTEDGEKEK